jgi:cytochrome P450
MLCCVVLSCGLQALSWTFYLLMQHPEVEQKLLEEIHQVLGPAQQQQDAASGTDGKAANSTDSDSEGKAAAAAADSSSSCLRPSYDQLRRLRYARAVFMEALRLYPSVPEVRVAGMPGGRGAAWSEQH